MFYYLLKQVFFLNCPTLFFWLINLSSVREPLVELLNFAAVDPVAQLKIYNVAHFKISINNDNLNKTEVYLCNFSTHASWYSWTHWMALKAHTAWISRGRDGAGGHSKPFSTTGTMLALDSNAVLIYKMFLAYCNYN